ARAQVLQVAQDIGAVARAHQRRGGGRGLAGVQRPAAVGVAARGVAGAGGGRGEVGGHAGIFAAATRLRLPCTPRSPPRVPPMKAPAYLDDDQIERLADLLDQRAVPYKGFNLEALDGYLSALVVGPG